MFPLRARRLLAAALAGAGLLALLADALTQDLPFGDSLAMSGRFWRAGPRGRLLNAPGIARDARFAADALRAAAAWPLEADAVLAIRPSTTRRARADPPQRRLRAGTTPGGPRAGNRERSDSRPAPGRTRSEMKRRLFTVAAALLLVLGFASAAFLAVRQPLSLGDYLAIWGLKARAIHASGELSATFRVDPAAEYSHPEYPPLWPLLLAGAAQLFGALRRAPVTLLRPLLLVLAAGLTFLRTRAPLPWRLLAAGALTLLPYFQTAAYTGYAEALLLVFVLAALYLLELPSPTPFTPAAAGLLLALRVADEAGGGRRPPCRRRPAGGSAAFPRGRDRRRDRSRARSPPLVGLSRRTAHLLGHVTPA